MSLQLLPGAMQMGSHRYFTAAKNLGHFGSFHFFQRFEYESSPFIERQQRKRLGQPVPDLVAQHPVAGARALYDVCQGQKIFLPALEIPRRIYRYAINPVVDPIEILASMNAAEDFYINFLRNILSILQITSKIERRFQNLPLKTHNKIVKGISATGLGAFDDVRQGLFLCQHVPSCIHMI